MFQCVCICMWRRFPRAAVVVAVLVGRRGVEPAKKMQQDTHMWARHPKDLQEREASQPQEEKGRTRMQTCSPHDPRLYTYTHIHFSPLPPPLLTAHVHPSSPPSPFPHNARGGGAGERTGLVEAKRKKRKTCSGSPGGKHAQRQQRRKRRARRWAKWRQRRRGREGGTLSTVLTDHA